jgi:predicted ester cyclase
VHRTTHAFVTATGGLRFDILEQVSDGDTVVTRWTGYGERLGQLLEELVDGDGPVRAGGITIHRFKDGRIVDSWTYWDAAGTPPPDLRLVTDEP